MYGMADHQIEVVVHEYADRIVRECKKNQVWAQYGGSTGVRGEQSSTSQATSSKRKRVDEAGWKSSRRKQEISGDMTACPST